MARLFVAVNPPSSTLDLVGSLPRPEARGVRWTPRAQWHVTLLFLAHADPAEVGERLGALEAARVEATLGPSPRPLGRGALVLAVDGLAPLAAKVHDVVGVRPDRPFVGHLTLARLDRRAARPVVEVPPGFADSPARRFDVTEVELVRSELHAAGAAHTVERTVTLRAAG